MLYISLLFLLVFIGSLVYFRSKRMSGTIAFFHPFCDDGGGGEAVLWTAIHDLNTNPETPKLVIYVYAFELTTVTESALRQKIEKRFGFDFDWERIKFVSLKSRTLLDPSRYRFFTLLLQFLAGFYVGFEGLRRLNPEIFIDTTGVPGTLPVFRVLGGAKTVAYVHYPVITSNMISRVMDGQEMYNNAGFIARSILLTYFKYIYYNIFSFMYFLCGVCTTTVLANGTWCMTHLSRVWKRKVTICYPPVRVKDFSVIPNESEKTLKDKVELISLGQMRPEKNHRVQLKTLALLKKASQQKFRLTIIGSVRHANDAAVVEDLRHLAKSLGLEEGKDKDFQFVHDASFTDMKAYMKKAVFALHTMIDEHFGIAVVELMAAGVIVVAHDSAGPAQDIIGVSPKTVGFLGKTPEDYVSHIQEVLERGSDYREQVRVNALEWAREKFDENQFRQNVRRYFS